MGEPSAGIHTTPARSSRRKHYPAPYGGGQGPTGQPRKRGGSVKRCGWLVLQDHARPPTPCLLPTRTRPTPVPLPGRRLSGDRVIPDQLVSLSGPGRPARSARPAASQIQNHSETNPAHSSGTDEVGHIRRSRPWCALRLAAHRSRPRAPGGSLAAHPWQMTLRALFRLVSPRHAEPATAGWRQITKASSSNATATRLVDGSSTASS
jgi:hypothetical protein